MDGEAELIRGGVDDVHDVTHVVDSLRYMVVSRTMAAQAEAKPEPEDDYDVMDYDDYMRGGVISKSYMGV